MMFETATPEHEAALARAQGVALGRETRRNERSRNDTVSLYALAVGFVLVAMAPIVMNPRLLFDNLVAFGLLAAAYSLVARIEFESELGACVPTMPVFVIALFTLPVTVVPAMVLVGSLLCLAPVGLYDPPTLRSAALRTVNGWFTLGPAGVLGATMVDQLTWQHWPILMAALVMQFALDAVAAAIRCAGVNQPLRSLVEPLRFTFAVDALLGVVTVALILSGQSTAVTVALAAAPIALVWLLSLDRRREVDTTVALGDAVGVARNEARIDGLTGLLNRRGWDEAVAAARERLATSAIPLSATVIVADVNELKSTNDRFGHDVGDIVIRSFADVLRVGSPSDAAIARIGGDEFAVLVVGPLESSADDGDELVRRLRLSTANARTPHGLSLSASLGVASSPPAGTIVEAIRQADVASYADKAAHRESRGGTPHNRRTNDTESNGVIESELVSAWIGSVGLPRS